MDVALMVEMENAKAWEEMNATRPEEEQLKKASGELVDALNSLDRAANYIADAAHTLDGTFAEDRVASMLVDLENMICELQEMKDRMKGGRL